MDRDNRWDRVEKAYDLLTLAKVSSRPIPPLPVCRLLMLARKRRVRESDRYSCRRSARCGMEDGDALIFMNFRADRAREILVHS